MSSQPFAFPPPPPAPLITSQTSPSYAPSHAGYDGYRGVYGGRGDRGERGSRFNRGHGRASSRGGSFGSSYSTSYNRFPLGGDGRYSLPPHVGHEAQAVERDGYPLPNYSPVPLPQHPPNLREEHRYQASAVPASTANVRPPQARYPPYMQGHTVNLNGQHQYAPNCYGLSAHNIQNIAPPALQNTNAPPAHAHADQPVLMGPPIRMGFDGQQKGFQNHLQSLSTATGTNAHKRGRPNSNDSPYRHESPMDSSATRNSPQAILPGHRGRGQKRGHRVAFSKPRYQNARTHVAPAVPSFGGPLPLPVKPPPPQENVPRPRKKRKNNQLGLTPKAEEHESSEEDAEDDADEESKLAATVGSSQGFQL